MQRVLPAAPKFPRAETPRRPTIPSRDRVAPLLPARRPSLSASRLATPLICRRILGTSLPAPQVALLACPLVAKKPRSASPSRVASQPASPLEAREPPSASPCRDNSRRSIRASGPGLLGLTPFLVVGATRRSASPCQAGRRCPQVLLRALPSQELSLVAGMIRPSVPIRRTGQSTGNPPSQPGSNTDPGTGDATSFSFPTASGHSTGDQPSQTGTNTDPDTQRCHVSSASTASGQSTGNPPSHSGSNR